MQRTDAAFAHLGGNWIGPERAGLGFRTTVIGAGLVTLLVPPVHAHSLLISRGQAVLHQEAITLTIEIAAEDFLHRHAVVGDSQGRLALDSIADAAKATAVYLSRSLVVRDAAGHRLPGAPFHVDVDWAQNGTIEMVELRALHAKYSASFSLPKRTPVVFFQIRDDASIISVPWQLVLGLRGATQEVVTTLRLTSRGNVEAVELAWQDGQASVVLQPTQAGIGTCMPCEERGTDRFKQVCADIDVGDENVRVRLWIPLPLLFTWITIADYEGDFLDSTQQAAAVRTFMPFLRDALIVRTQTGSILAEVSKAAITTLYSHDSEDDPISVWTGCLQAEVRFRSSGSIEGTFLQWNLFNGAVLSVPANVRAAGTCTEHDITTYHSSIALGRPSVTVP